MQPQSLYYMRKRNWIPLPQWGQFFLDLGYALAIRDNPESRVIAGLALPTRAYAAALAATGIVAGTLSLLTQDAGSYTRFQELCTLEIGSSLIYRTGNKRVKVFFDGAEVRGGDTKILLRAENQKGGLTYVIGQKHALQVEFPAKEFTSLPKRSYGRTDRTVSPFLTHFLDQETAKAVVLQSHLDCMIIGSIGRLDQEINCTSFATQNAKGEFVSGTLQDVLRVRRFSTNAETYRSDIYYTHTRDHPRDHPGIHQEMPAVIIFDGSTSYLKWRAFWRHPHCIVLLDQTEPGFDAAVQTFNEECIKNHLNDMAFKTQLKAPKGVPVSIYQEVRK
jgi:hypothetical protein